MITIVLVNMIGQSDNCSITSASSTITGGPLIVGSHYSSYAINIFQNYKLKYQNMTQLWLE